MRLYTLLIIVISVCLFSCSDEDYKDAPMNNLANYSDVVFDDYSKLPTNSQPFVYGYFTPKDDAPFYLTTWLNNNYFSADVGSTISLVYDFMDYDRDNNLVEMSRDISILRAKDYRFIWGTPYVEAFTPAKSAFDNLPLILKNNETQAKNGDYRVMQYNVSSEEPTVEPNKEITYYAEDFNNIGGAFWDEIKVPNSYNLELTQKGRKWRVYDRNGIRGMMAYQNGVKIGDGWFITEQIDLASAVDPKFSVDIGVGYYSGDYLKIYMCDSENFNLEDPSSIQWIDVTDNLGVNNLPKASGYPTPSTIEIKVPESLVGKAINIAFRNQLPESEVAYAQPTLYLVDNIKIYETRPYASVPSMTPEWAVYSYNGDNWSKKEDVIVLQQEDYETLGLYSLTLEQAHEFIPVFLTERLPSAVEGDKVFIVYKQTETMSYADSYEFKLGKWQYEELPEVSKKKAYFSYKSLSEKWKFVE